MANPANEVHGFRSEVTSFSDSMRSVEGILSRIEDFGADDQARIAFFQDAMGADTDHPDITPAQFFAGVVALRALRVAWNTNKLAIVQLRR